MAQALSVFLPLFGFMLIPVWIPLTGAICGAIHDRLRQQRVSPALAAVQVAKARTAVRAGQRPVEVEQVEAEPIAA